MTGAVADTLGLVGDGDEMDFVDGLQQSFNVDFGLNLRHWITVGDIFDDLIVARGPSDVRGKCATSMAFYRLRRASPVFKPGLRPSTRLADLGIRDPKRFSRELERASGLRLPIPNWTWTASLGCLVILAAAAMLGAQMVGTIAPYWVLATLTLGAALLWFDRGTFGIKTIGDLARDVAALNAGKLMDQGADSRETALWNALVAVIEREPDVKAAAIGRTTRLFSKA